MAGYIPRTIFQKVRRSLAQYPVVALLGPRQVGKSTLAKKVIESTPGGLYLDLERPSERRKLDDAESFLEQNRAALVCLDEIQLLPEIFPLLRSLVDERGRNGQFLVLGSVSRDLLRQSSETLAGRIAYLEMTPLLASESIGKGIEKLWLRGGLPKSYLGKSEESSLEWRENYIKTFLERDIPRLGIRIQTQNVERLWKMLAHSHGQTLNSSKLAGALGVSTPTVNSYIHILEQSFLLRKLPPFSSNLKKRLVKSPKIYIRDSGILHALLEIESTNDLFGHPVYGDSFEGFAIEQILSHCPRWNFAFYRTRSGAEMDLILSRGRKTLAVEIKTSKSPTPGRGFWEGIKDISSDENYIIAPVSSSYALKGGVRVIPLQDFVRILGKM